MRKTVLVVDGGGPVRRCVERKFRKWSCVVFTALGSQEALPILETLRVDILIANLEAPGVSGSGLLRRARQVQPALACVVVHGSPEEALAKVGDGESPRPSQQAVTSNRQPRLFGECYAGVR
jgi:CheY-like chemotaxis protein